MRNYLSPAKKYVSRIAVRSVGILGRTSRHRVFVVVAIASIIAIVAISAVYTRGKTPQPVNSDAMATSHDEVAQQQTTIKTAPGQSVETHVRSSGSGRDTPDVTVNGRQINVPRDGTVRETFRTKNGTTRVDISTNSTSSGSNSSSITTNFNVHTNTRSQTYEETSP